MEPKTIIFIGPSGSGKGTQVKAVTEYLESNSQAPVLNIETGKGFRDLTEKGSFTATRVRELLADGQLVPNFLAESFVVKFLIKNLTPESHLTMDGFPRTLPQVDFIDELIEFYQRPKPLVVHLQVSDDVVRERLLARGRNEDVPELISERLRLYHEKTEPIVTAFKNRENVTFIQLDASQSAQDVTKKIIAALD